LIAAGGTIRCAADALSRRSTKEEVPKMLVRGACHCGNVSLMLDWQPEPNEIPARACSCTFCVKHGGVWTSCPTGSLVVDVSDPSRVSKYSFGTKTACFHVCSVCGAVPVATSDIEDNTFAVVNVNTFEGLDSLPLKRIPVTFEGEDRSTRLGRRAKTWISNVRFTGS
jgi:hypothetical protein